MNATYSTASETTLYTFQIQPKYIFLFQYFKDIKATMKVTVTS